MTPVTLGISNWPDAAEVAAKARNLVAQAPRPLSREKMAECHGWFDQQCPGSKRAHEEAVHYIPGGVQHNLAFNHPFPLSIAKAEGAHLWDVDGNRYIDFLQAGGATLLGSNYPPVQEAVLKVIRDCSPVTGLFHDYEVKLAKLIHEFMPNVELFRMLASGTEACMAAIRAARNFSGKRHVIKMGGGYHGWSDQLLYGTRIPGTGNFEAAGIPDECNELTHEFFPNDIDGLRELLETNQNKGGTAAVLVEPLGSESGVRLVDREFNAKVRALCDEFDTLLIFDEVVTGFRLGLGGVQGYLGVKPDLTVFGKCVAGGYPGAGGVGGRRDIMNTFTAGIGSGQQRTIVGGTLSASPISCAAGYHALLAMAETDAPAKAGRAGDRLCAGLQAILDTLDTPFFVYNIGSIVHLETHGVLRVDLSDPDFFMNIMTRKKIAEEMSAAYAAAGIITIAGGRLYTSMADTDEVIDEALERFRSVLAAV
jgi:glutamate-1-semialdehyde 2,1-aminomutase